MGRPVVQRSPCLTLPRPASAARGFATFPGYAGGGFGAPPGFYPAAPQQPAGGQGFGGHGFAVPLYDGGGFPIATPGYTYPPAAPPPQQAQFAPGYGAQVGGVGLGFTPGGDLVVSGPPGTTVQVVRPPPAAPLPHSDDSASDPTMLNVSVRRAAPPPPHDAGEASPSIDAIESRFAQLQGGKKTEFD